MYQALFFFPLELASSRAKEAEKQSKQKKITPDLRLQISWPLLINIGILESGTGYLPRSENKKNCQQDQYDDNDMIDMELMLPEIITFGNQCFGIIQSEENTWLFTKKPYNDWWKNERW